MRIRRVSGQQSRAYLRLPEGVTRTEIQTGRGVFAALTAVPHRRRGTVLLVPGWTGSKEDFIALLPLLLDAGWAAVSYDQRGQFESAATAGDDFTLNGFAADAVAVAQAVDDEPVHVIGHSFGGIVGQTMALQHPDRLASLTLLCSGPGALTDDSAIAGLRRMVRLLAGATLNEVYAAKLRYDAESRPGRAPAVEEAEFLRQRFLRNHPQSLAAITSLLLSAEDRIEELAALALPVHVVYGVADDGWPTVVQDDMATWLGVEAHVVPDAGHSPAIDNPQETAHLLMRLLTSRPTAPAAPAPPAPADKLG